MGTIRGLLGTSGGMGGTGFSAPSGTTGTQINNSYNANQGSLEQQQNLLGALQNQNGLGNQSQVYNQLQGVVNGAGPNPAQTMLNQSTAANVANQAALMGGQRGAAQNVGLIARQAGQQGMQAQQQAAGQGASMEAQQSLGALGQAGQMANTQAANQIGQTNANTSAQQSEQSILQGANTQNNAIQGQLANTQLGAANKFQSGLINSAGGAAGLPMADGGAVPSGSAFGPQSMFAQAVLMPQTQTPTFSQYSPGDDKKAPKQQKPDPMAAQNANIQNDADNVFGGKPQQIQDPTVSRAKGGEVPVALSPGELKVPPEKVPQVASGKINPMAAGSVVPGTPKVKGNSYANDTYKTKAKPGTVIIPNSVMQSKDPMRGAADFVRDVLAKKRKKA